MKKIQISSAIALAMLAIGSSTAMAQTTSVPHTSGSTMGATAPMSAPATLDRPYGSNNAPPYRPTSDGAMHNTPHSPNQMNPGPHSSGSTGYGQPSGTSQTMGTPAPLMNPTGSSTIAVDRNTMPYEWQPRTGSTGRNDIPGLPRQPEMLGSGLYNGD